jgi:hypothetical protein
MAARAHFKRLVRIEQTIGGDDGRERIAALRHVFSDFEKRCSTERAIALIKGVRERGELMRAYTAREDGFGRRCTTGQAAGRRSRAGER